MFIWMLDVALGTEKRKELWERQSKEESAGKLEVGGKGVGGGEGLGISYPRAGATGSLHRGWEGEEADSALACIAGAEEGSVDVWV